MMEVSGGGEGERDRRRGKLAQIERDFAQDLQPSMLPIPPKYCPNNLP